MEPDKSLHQIAKFFSSELSEQQLRVNKNIARKNLINILNYIDFQNETILLNFKHVKNNSRVSLPGKPLACFDRHFECRFVENVAKYINKYDLESLFITYDDKFIMVKPVLREMDETKIRLDLPDIAWEVNYREHHRYQGSSVEVQVIQESIAFYGKLLEFSAVSFSVSIPPMSPNSFLLINKSFNVIVILKNNDGVVFSGECKIIREKNIAKEKIFVLEPLSKVIHRFKSKEYRSERVNLLPAPTVNFKHPLSDKMIHLEVDDISGSGLSMKEVQYTSTLFPGLILPELKIHLGGDCIINTSAQVLYRVALEENSGDFVKCGIAFIDMDMQDQVKLSNVLQRASNIKLQVCNHLDLESLWKLLFETGFIYPQKYASIQNNKEKYKELYAKLYLQPNDIFRHFVYQEAGKIYGHVAMVRFYQNTWLFHHHSARNSTLGKAGIYVQRQIAQYANDFSSLDSTHMRFILIYFRPENRFPARIYGGLAASLSDRGACSLDEFAYLNMENLQRPLKVVQAHMQRNGLEVSASCQEDLLQLQGFYDNRHGGLLLDALDLKVGMTDDREIDATYQKIGIQRQRSLFSLAKNGDLHAIIMVTVSDTGLNLSNLTNCLHVIVVDSDDFSGDDLFCGISYVLQKYDRDDKNKMPILIHPLNYVEKERIDYDKVYNLWIFNVSFLDTYFSFLESMVEKHKIKK